MKTKLLLLLFLPLLGWSQTLIGTRLLNPNENNIKPSKYGESVAISSDGTIIAVGGPGNNENSFVKVYKYENNVWKQFGDDIINENILERVGNSVALSSNGYILAIGAEKAGNLDEGHVRVYQNKNNKWEKIGNSIIGDGIQHLFGHKVVISGKGDIIAASSIKGNSKRGYVKVYRNESGTWKQIGTTIKGKDKNDYLGSDIDLSFDGKTLVIGAWGEDEVPSDSGQVQVYEFINNKWSQIGVNINGDLGGDRFGTSVAVSDNGKIFAASAPLYNVNNSSLKDAGQVKIFKNISGTWTQKGTDIFGTSNRGFLGSSLSFSSDGNTLLIGESDENTVYVYEFTNGDWILKGNSINKSHDFGESVNITSDGETFIVGASGGFAEVYSFKQTLSLEKEQLSMFTRVYPNPVINKITISFSNGNTLKKATIFNVQGKILIESTNKEISTDKLPSGIYFLEIETNKGKITKKLIKK
jgi:WD40 repeat protein